MNILIERTIELNAPLLTEPLPGSLFTTEAKAHQFLIGCTQSGLPVTLSGTVTAKFIREANNTTILMSGSISGGKASLILPADCYNISGRFDLTIFVTANNITTCIYSATGSVKAAQDGTLVDEGTVVPSIEQLQQDVTNLQNSKVNRAGDTMTGWLRWFASSPVTGLEWASADGTLFQLRPYTSGNILQFVVVPQGTGTATGAITIQNDGTIGFSKPVPITSGGTGAGSAASARTNLSVYSKAETDAYIASRQYSVRGNIINSGSSGTTVGYGKATVAIIGQTVIVDFAAKITTAGSVSNVYDVGIGISALRSLNSELPSFNVTNGGNINYLTSGGAYSTLNGYAGEAIANTSSNRWNFARLYNTSGSVGAFSDSIYSADMVITGRLYGSLA